MPEIEVSKAQPEPGTISVLPHPDLGPVLSRSEDGKSQILGQTGWKAYVIQIAFSFIQSYLQSRIARRLR